MNLDFQLKALLTINCPSTKSNIRFVRNSEKSWETRHSRECRTKVKLNAVRPRKQRTSRPESNDRAADSTSVFDSLAEAVAGNDQVSPEPQTFVKFMQDEELLQGDDDHEIHPEDDDDVSVQWISEDEERRAIEAGFQYIDVENEHYKDNYDERKASPSGRKPLPVEVRCFDTARIYVKGGDGGRGCVAFRREKYVPRGGPSGGNGGLGGSVWLEADISLNSLLSFRRKIHFRADPGSPGQGSDMHGGAGKDMVIKVPPGTIARPKGAASSEEDSILAEVLKPGHRVMLAAGGRGGRGNQSFKTSRNTAPTMAELGEKGQEIWVDLELRLVADAGIVGVPNAGKSTLLSVLSAAKPKVADYPFTTLTPNLGVCVLDFRSTVFADVPGLLEGAHSGVGLGHQFLRHCQRCRVLVHVVDGTSPDPLGDYDAIRQELTLFSPKLVDKPQIVAYNKMDVPDSSDYWGDVQEGLLQRGVDPVDIIAVSAVSGQGVTDLVRRVRVVLDSLPPEEMGDPAIDNDGDGVAAAVRARRAEARIGEFTIQSDLRGPRVWTVRGEAIERFAQMTDWSYYEAAKRFQGVLEAAGITSALKAQGIKEGDTVAIGNLEFEHSDDTSEGAMFDKWYSARRAAGVANRGSARWPHAGG